MSETNQTDLFLSARDAITGEVGIESGKGMSFTVKCGNEQSFTGSERPCPTEAETPIRIDKWIVAMTIYIYQMIKKYEDRRRCRLDVLQDHGILEQLEGVIKLVGILKKLRGYASKPYGGQCESLARANDARKLFGIMQGSREKPNNQCVQFLCPNSRDKRGQHCSPCAEDLFGK